MENPVPAPAGMYIAVAGATNPTEQGQTCGAGTVCPEGSTAPISNCPPGYYCTAGETIPVMCPVGTYKSGTSSLSGSVGDCTTCPVDTYCGVEVDLKIVCGREPVANPWA